MTYRQPNGGSNDFWTGPLDEVTATITASECAAWDKHFKVTREEVELHVANYQNPNYTMPASIKNWPAHGNYNNPIVGFRNLAPFYSPTGNIDYDPESGDYPDYNVTGTNDNASLFGDQTLWWVFNDKGNIHTETEAEPLHFSKAAKAPVTVIVWENSCPVLKATAMTSK